jgi:hypothetical protein
MPPYNYDQRTGGTVLKNLKSLIASSSAGRYFLGITGFNTGVANPTELPAIATAPQLVTTQDLVISPETGEILRDTNVKAVDANVVHLTGNESFDGIKTATGIEFAIKRPKTTQRRITFNNTTDTNQMIMYQPANSDDLRVYNTLTGKDQIELKSTGETKFSGTVFGNNINGFVSNPNSLNVNQKEINVQASGATAQEITWTRDVPNNRGMRWIWWDSADGSIIGTPMTKELWGYKTDINGNNTTFEQFLSITKDPTTDEKRFNFNSEVYLDGRKTTGAWTSYTPIVTGAATAGTGQTYTVQQGYYKVIGKTCHIRINLRLSSFGTAAGFLIVSQPFTTATGGAGVDKTIFSGYACDIGVAPMTGNKGIPETFGTSTGIAFHNAVDANNLTIAGCNSNTVFRISGTYEIA